MTQFAGKGLPLGLGMSSIAAQEMGWRNVPKINLLGGRRETRLTPLVLALIAVILVQLLLLRHFYTGLNGNNELAEKARGAVGVANQELFKQEGVLADIDEQMATIDNEMKALVEQHEMTIQTYQELAGGRVIWAAPVRTLLTADAIDLRFKRLETTPDGLVTITGIAEDFDAIGRFQSQMSELKARGVLELCSLKSDAGDAVQEFTAEVKVGSCS